MATFHAPPFFLPHVSMIPGAAWHLTLSTPVKSHVNSSRNAAALVCRFTYNDILLEKRLIALEETRKSEERRQQEEVMVVGVDESELSLYALQWTLDCFFAPFAPHFPFKLVVVHAKPSPASVIGVAGPRVIKVLPIVDADLRKIAAWVTQKAKDICDSRSVHDVTFQVMEGDARSVLCDAVEKHHASVLVVGSHGHGAMKRAVSGSVSDYCSHHAHCTVLIVKRPKIES
ncbi:uncharacterized protein LOC115673398 [Syzygium oleosum]|uniref:uncharacterized protein LOC115673398 n=1 Tax=Syzygium oleosum TaxID=219896 RepID=UPI0024BBBA75|nr:uncharacterized protein LOC115673398 [Syzygium oleosum]